MAADSWLHFPNRVWEQSHRGWYSREVTPADMKRRADLEAEMLNNCMEKRRNEDRGRYSSPDGES